MRGLGLSDTPYETQLLQLPLTPNWLFGEAIHSITGKIRAQKSAANDFHRGRKKNDYNSNKKSSNNSTASSSWSNPRESNHNSNNSNQRQSSNFNQRQRNNRDNRSRPYDRRQHSNQQPFRQASGQQAGGSKFTNAQGKPNSR